MGEPTAMLAGSSSGPRCATRSAPVLVRTWQRTTGPWKTIELTVQSMLPAAVPPCSGAPAGTSRSGRIMIVASVPALYVRPPVGTRNWLPTWESTTTVSPSWERTVTGSRLAVPMNPATKAVRGWW